MREEEIFLEALARDPADRAAFLDRVCPDPAVRASVEALLRANIGASRFLESPVEPAITVDLPSKERPGTVIGPYKLLEQIGEGGFGAVFMAEQSEPVRRKVALKVLKAGMDTRQVVARFEAERQALAIMDHPNIARVFDGGATPSGRPYFVMELVKGAPITEYCDQNHLTPRQRLELFMQVCHAVQHAHQKGIIHRDIKPSNVLVMVHDTAPVVKVIDFGVAKAMGQELTDKTLFTGFAQMIGTPLYMSPEQAGQSGLDVDTRSDIYSLGVLLYELLTGSTPFPKERFRQAAYEEIRRIIREEEPPKPSTRLSSCTDSLPSISAQRQTEPAKLTKLVRGELDWIVMKALEKDRNRRYETANGFAMDVQRYLSDEAVEACPPSAGYRFRKFARRNRGRLVAASVLAVAALVATSSIGYAVRDRSARQAEAERERNERQARVTTQVELLLADVDRLTNEQKWPEALSMAKRAEATLAGGEADEATREKVADVIRDLQFVERLANARLQRGIIVDGKLDNAGAVREYRREFEEMGFDQSVPGRTEFLASRCSNRPGMGVMVAAALDDWAEAARGVPGTTPSDWLPLVQLARRVDPDPLRGRLRDTWAQPTTPNLQSELHNLAQGLDARKQRPETLVVLAVALQKAKLESVAEEILRRGQQQHPGDFFVNMELGKLLRGKPTESETYIRIALALQPRNARAHLWLGVAKYDQEQMIASMTSYQNAIELDPKFAIAHNNLGAVFLKQKKIDEALSSFQKAIQLDPRLAMAHNNLGVLFNEQKKYEEAFACYRKAIEFNPREPSYHNNLGNVLRRLNRLEEAIKCHARAIELDSKYAIAHDSLGSTLFAQGKSDAAITSYRRAIELDPKYAKALYNLGLVLGNQKKVEEAIVNCRKAIEIDPNLAHAHYALGVAMQQQGKRDEAVASYRKALELDPELAPALNNLGSLLIKMGKVDEAIASYRSATQFDPNDAYPHLNLGNLFRDLGKLEEAIACYRKAVEVAPKLATAHNSLGIASTLRRSMTKR